MAQDTRPESSNEPFNVETKLNPQSLQPHPQQLHDQQISKKLLKLIKDTSTNRASRLC
jgi:hypothetical protein